MFEFYKKDVTHSFKIEYYQFTAVLRGIVVRLVEFIGLSLFLLLIYFWYQGIHFQWNDLSNLKGSEKIMLVGVVVGLLVAVVLIIVLVGYMLWILIKLILMFGSAVKHLLSMLTYPFYITRYSLAKWEEEWTKDWEQVKKKKDIS